MTIDLKEFAERINLLFPTFATQPPWVITEQLNDILFSMIAACGETYIIENGIARHATSVIEQNVVLKPPVIIGANTTIGANAYIRGGVLLDEHVHIGAGCEIKQSVICSRTAVAHFNYIGNSIIGSNVNFEAGSVAANHYNERDNKLITVLIRESIIETGVRKFGSLVGDGSRIGANAVLSPGTILEKNSIVKRLELVQQVI
jgi:UDP-N-acetylglucosamine diphosphorylase / glucose-1-phosphate thymidylyltransferase / UDP-N-acetylgalactosamine diphosphorylase / glucosamine-1-phosphate N-acetyltransferase / galactosamine-1-phosphate N-acetyltransferase